MILSRSIARRRIVNGARPSVIAAWGLVLADAIILFVVLALLWAPFRALSNEWPIWATSAALFVVGFIPIQMVLITSALWAAKSRWRDEEVPQDG